jgi:3-oxoacyl-[acyl-carrier protein] reductase
MERVVVISGGGTGLGLAMAKSFADGGDHVVILGRREHVLRAAAGEIGGRVSYLQADVSDPSQVQRVAAELKGAHGTIDVVIANAGGFYKGPDKTLHEIAERWLSDFRQNTLTAVLLVSAMTPLLRRPGGRVIIMSSQAATSGRGNYSYGAAKAGLNRWMRTLASQLGPEGVTANVIAPGFVPDTSELVPEMVATEELHDRVLEMMALRRPGTPEEVAALARHLASPAGGFMTGTVVEIDGGHNLLTL